MVDKEAIKRYRFRRDKRMGKREDQNDKHDKLGRFAPKGGSGAKTAEEMTKDDIKVRGPQGSKEYIKTYLKENPKDAAKIKADAKTYADALKKVRDFAKDHPDAVDGTYNMVTGKLENPVDGYCLTFHQNHEIGDEFGGYDDKTYAMMAAIAKHELGSDGVYIGYFGNPEISFNCKNYQQAKKYCVAHNQYSLYDAKMGREWVNDAWDESKNPIKGRGKN